MSHSPTSGTSSQDTTYCQASMLLESWRDHLESPSPELTRLETIADYGYVIPSVGWYPPVCARATASFSCCINPQQGHRHCDIKSKALEPSMPYCSRILVRWSPWRTQEQPTYVKQHHPQHMPLNALWLARDGSRRRAWVLPKRKQGRNVPQRHVSRGEKHPKKELDQSLPPVATGAVGLSSIVVYEIWTKEAEKKW